VESTEALYALSFLGTTFVLATPLLFSALGGYFSERSGTVNIALEGLILAGAFGAGAGASYFHSPMAGIFCAFLAALSLGAFLGVLVIRWHIDAVLAGFAVNLLAIGLVPLAGKILFGATGATPSLAEADRLTPVYGQSPLLCIAALTAVATMIVHSQTRLGQRLRFAGELPEGLRTVGIDPDRYKWIGLGLCSILCALAGAFLSIEHGAGFTRNMSAGRGYIALAAVILGRWRPLQVTIWALVLGSLEAAQLLLQNLRILNDTPLPVQWVQMAPYIFTLLAIARKKFGLKKPLVFLAPVLALGLLTGCENADRAAALFNTKLGPILGFQLLKTKNHAAPAPTPTSRLNSVNGEFLHELFLITLERQPLEEEFVRLLNALEQKGSMEGIYNGIVYSREYRDRERGSAPISSVKAYARWMTQLAIEQQHDPLRLKQDPNAATEALQGLDARRAELQEKYEREALSLSNFALKRRLAEEALKTVELKKEYREKLATWFGKFALFANTFAVDFGLAQRNNPDEYFHYKWALEADLDRVKWECINRVHRVLK
jgi:ABC-type uncharacterized transport system permease subunit